MCERSQRAPGAFQSVDELCINPRIFSYAPVSLAAVRPLVVSRGPAELGLGFHLVEVVAVVVSAHEKSDHVRYILDDGTKLLPATQWLQNQDGTPREWRVRGQLGDVLRIRAQPRSNDTGESESRSSLAFPLTLIAC
eukprot:scaffold731_cov261-Pinguiococcus_pyrenoidosus.AAC.69